MWHIVTGEYPPQPGGVSDYTLAVARGLAGQGETVHVWCPGEGATPAETTGGVTVHREAGTWGRTDCARIDAALDALPRPRRVLVQWVPQAFGHRSMNLAFCRWARRRARAGDQLDVMVHEAFLPFREGAWRHDVAAAVHRLMVWTLLARARHVWVSIPAWADALAPYRPSRSTIAWLPVPSNVPVTLDPQAVARLRAAVAEPGAGVVGHFSTYGGLVRADMARLVPLVAERNPAVSWLLAGRGSLEFRDEVIARHPALAGRVHATGALDAPAVSTALQACDLVVQPFPDGVSSRRGSVMAALVHGRPVVTTEGRLSEPLWRETGAVRLAPARDAVALADAAVDLLADEGERERLGRAARTLYEARFDLAHTIRALLRTPGA